MPSLPLISTASQGRPGRVYLAVLVLVLVLVLVVLVVLVLSLMMVTVVSSPVRSAPSAELVRTTVAGFRRDSDGVCTPMSTGRYAPRPGGWWLTPLPTGK